MRRVSWILLGALAVLVALAWGCQRALLFPGGGKAPAQPLSARVPGAIAIDVEHAEGRSEGILLPAHGGATRSPVVVFAHGNGELIDGWVAALEPYRAQGIAVAMLEYRGYGRSAGAATEASLVADFAEFVGLIAARPEVDPTRIVYHGRSLGGGVVAAATAIRPPRALIIESSFTSVATLAREGWRVPRFLVRDPFESLAALERYRGLSLVIHGRRDALVPFAHGERLAARPGARLLALDCGHNDCPRGEAYWTAVRALLADAGVR